MYDETIYQANNEVKAKDGRNINHNSNFQCNLVLVGYPAV